MKERQVRAFVVQKISWDAYLKLIEPMVACLMLSSKEKNLPKRKSSLLDSWRTFPLLFSVIWEHGYQITTISRIFTIIFFLNMAEFFASLFISISLRFKDSFLQNIVVLCLAIIVQSRIFPVCFFIHNQAMVKSF